MILSKVLVAVLGAWSVAAAGVQSLPVAAPSSPSAELPLLWENLREGMSQIEVRSLQPNKYINLGDGCSAEIFPIYKKKRLNQVNLVSSSKGENERCSEVILRATLDKYGRPDEARSTTNTGHCGSQASGGVAGVLAGLCKITGGDTTESRTHITWIRDGLHITLHLDNNSATYWEIGYRQAPVVSEAVKSRI